MMITIHGLPPMTTFQTVKGLVRQECNLIDFIVDNLVDDGPNSKKVRIGLSDEAEGYRILKCLNGFRMSPSHVLKIVPVGKVLNPPPHQNYDQSSGFPNQPRNEYPNQPRPEYQNHSINEYENRGPQGPHGSIHSRPAIVKPNANMQRQHGPPEPRQPVSHRPEPRDAGHQGDLDPMHSQQWGPNPTVNSSNNHWAPHGQGSHMSSQDAYNQRQRQPGFVPQHTQRTKDPYAQGRGPPDQGYGLQPKPSPNEPAPNRRNALRMVDIVEDPRAPARPQEKPITIMKDNFQGPSQHLGPFPGPGQGPVWEKAGPKPQAYDDRRHPPLGRDVPSNVGRNYQERGRRVSPQGRSFPIGDRRNSPIGRLGPPVKDFSPSGRRISPTGRKTSPCGRRVAPPGRTISPPGKRISPPGRRISPPGRRISSPGRRISPPGTRISPPGRRVSSPGRRISPPGTRISPPGRRVSSPGRRISPTGRRISPSGRRISPTGRRVSPPGIRNSQSGGRISPPGRGRSPGRRISPGRRAEPRRMSPNERGMPRRERESPRLVSPPPRLTRFSPTRLGAGGKPADKFTDGKWLKPVRPTYESSQAQNQTYTGGDRKNVHENDQYPASRQETQILPWQVDQVMYPSNVKKREQRRDAARRQEKPAAKSPERRSRSPMRRSRSPPKERYRRHSPSPRSPRSPRRSWALEKRSSPAPREPPPPPVWPGQEPGEQPPRPDWDRERRPTQDKLRVRSDLHEDKFASRREDGAREIRARDGYCRDEFRPDKPRRTEKVFSDIDKDFQGIYQRDVEMRKKTEERKSGERRREDERYRRDESPPRSRERERNDRGKPASGEWNTVDRNHIVLYRDVKDKRNKAVVHLAECLLQKYDIKGEHKVRVTEELKHTLFYLLLDMFAGKDMSYNELVVKFQTKYRGKDEDKLMQEVVSRLPSQYRGLKRRADEDLSGIAAKTLRSPPRNTREDIPRPKLSETIKRRYVSSALHKSGTSAVKRSPVVRDIVKKPVIYGKSDLQVNKSTKDVSPQKPGALKVTESIKKASKAVDPKKVEVKKPSEPSSVEPTLNGHYELSPLMSKMLEAELEDVMIKIRESFPDNAVDQADRLVDDRFRNKAGDELRNTLGLNITKRLLNVHNTLYVKILFSRQPLRAHLATFLNNYRISAFKRVGDLTYAAKMKSFHDFDELCTNKNLRCGEIHVTVTPCYQFLTCPPNLRTCYSAKRDNKLNQNNQESTITTAKSVKNSGQEAKPVTDDIPSKGETKEINENKTAIKANTTSVKADESQTTKLIEKDIDVQQKSATASKHNVTPKVTPAKHNQPANSQIAAKGPPPEANQTVSVNKVDQKATSMKTNVPATDNKQATAKIAPAKSSENVTQKQNTTPKVTPAIPNAAATQKQNTATTPAKSIPAATQKQIPAPTPAKPNLVAPQKQNSVPIPAKPSPTAAPKQISAPLTAKPNPATAEKQNPAHTPTKPIPTAAPKQIPAPITAKPNPAATEKQNPATKVTPTIPQIQTETTRVTPQQNLAATQKQSLALTPKVTSVKTNIPTTENKQASAKITPAKSGENYTQKQNPTPKVTPAKSNVAAQKQTAKVTPELTNVNNQKLVSKSNSNKAEQGSKPNVAAKVTPAKAAVVNKRKVAPTKVVTPLKRKPITAKKIPARDFDELDDHDILAMLSQGIVLDECSGSEEN